MKTKFLLALIPFILCSCTETKMITDNQKNDGGSTQTDDGNNQSQNDGGSTQTDEGNNQSQNDGGSTQTDGGNNQSQSEGDSTHDDGGNNESQDQTSLNELIPTNKAYELDDYTNFTWHNGREPEYADDWNFFEKTTHNPNGHLWENPNYEYSGVEFVNKNCFIISPLFNSWKKIEVRLSFWFSSHQSSKYKATKNEPQYFIEEYSNIGKLLAKESVYIEKSDLPKNNQAKEFRTYLDEDDCAYFIVRCNNYVANGDSGYTFILCDATLKGWPYDVNKNL